jgi:hypothetical protein
VAALWFTHQTLSVPFGQRPEEQPPYADGDRHASGESVPERLDSWLGGLYLLEQLVSDHPSQSTPLFTVVYNFIRAHSNEMPCPAWVPAEQKSPLIDVMVVVESGYLELRSCDVGSPGKGSG